MAKTQRPTTYNLGSIFAGMKPSKPVVKKATAKVAVAKQPMKKK
jgi:hypothetical protein